MATSGDDDKKDTDAVVPYKFPPALPHGKIEEVLKNVYMVKGTVSFTYGFFPPFVFSRNMTIVKSGNDNLTIINSVRLNEEGLQELDKLGKVNNIVRIAGYHGQDDPFYHARYSNATVWAPCQYFSGFDYPTANPYFTNYKQLTSATEGRDYGIPNSSIMMIESSKPAEAIMVLDHSDGSKVLVTGDSLQNFQQADQFFSWTSAILMRYMMGFIKPYNIGPGWYDGAKPKKSELVQKLCGDMKFDHVLPAHGTPCLGNAWQKYAPAIRALKEQPEEKTK